MFTKIRSNRLIVCHVLSGCSRVYWPDDLGSHIVWPKNSLSVWFCNLCFILVSHFYAILNKTIAHSFISIHLSIFCHICNCVRLQNDFLIKSSSIFHSSRFIASANVQHNSKISILWRRHQNEAIQYQCYKYSSVLFGLILTPKWFDAYASLKMLLSILFWIRISNAKNKKKKKIVGLSTVFFFWAFLSFYFCSFIYKYLYIVRFDKFINFSVILLILLIIILNVYLSVCVCVNKIFLNNEIIGSLSNCGFSLTSDIWKSSFLQD